MNKALGIGFVVLAAAATLVFVTAGKSQQQAAANVQPPGAFAIATTAAIVRYDGGPRIIHVPQPGEENASVNDRDEPEAGNGDDVEELAPPPRKRVAPKPQRRSDAPPEPRRKPFSSSPPLPPSQRRTVLSAPPPGAQGPTPIHATPRFDSRNEQADKFDRAQDDQAATASVPFDGYAPPATLPRRN